VTLKARPGHDPQVAPSADPLIGTLLGGRYAIRDVLGGGAMGTVYRARQVWLERDVAVKVLRRGGAVDSKARRRLHREARAVARIHNPHVVQVHDYGETSVGAPFLVMELVPGPTAEAWFRGSPDRDAVLQAVDGVLAGLAAAHARGVLHRDLKPANMLVRSGDPSQLVLVDFGIAGVFQTGTASLSLSAVEPVDGVLSDDVEALLKDERDRSRAARRGEERITQEGTVVGTPLYMAPEQALGQTVGPAADVYAATVVLYEWLSGRPPFTGAIADVMRSHAYRVAPPLRARSGLRVPESLRLLIARALSKDPRDRPESAGAMRAELREIARPSAVVSVAPQAPRPPPPQPSLPRDTVELTGGAPAPAGPTTPLSRARRLPASLPLVGRDEELARLGRVLGEVRSGHGRVVLIEGRAGMGKSRLADEFTTRLQEEGEVWVGRGSAIQDGLPHPALRRAIEDLLQGRALGGDALRERIQVALGGADLAHGGLSTEERNALLGWLRPEASQSVLHRGWEVALLERALRVLATRRPVVLWLDDADLEGADGAQVIEQLAAALRLEPFPLLVLATRTTTAERSREARPWLGLSRREGDVVRRVALSPLQDDAIIDLALASLPLTGAAASRIAERAGGSPLVAGHLLRHLVESERLVEVGRRLGLEEGDSLRDALPGSLRGMMADRLERARDGSETPDVAGLVLQSAAALGERFSVDVLAVALPAADVALSEAALDDLLDELLATGVLREEEAPGEDVLAFEHPAMVGVLVDELVSSRRGRRRARELAKCLLGQAPELQESLAPALVRLLERCGAEELLPEPAARAGSQALASGRLGEATRLFQTALGSGAQGAVRRRALEGGATANQLLGHHDAAFAQLEELLASPPAEPDEGLRARALSALGRSQLSLGWGPEAAVSLEEALELHRARLPEAAASREVARTLSSLARLSEILPGRSEAAVDPGALLAVVHTPHDRYVVAVAMGYLAGRRGEHDVALRLLNTALSAARSAGYRPGVVTTLFDLGWTERRAGRLRDARAHLAECLTLASALGRRPMEARAQNELGELLRAAGDLAGARKHYEEAVALAQHLDGPEPLVAELNLALTEALAGDAEQGQARLAAMHDAGRVAAWLMPPWLLTMALCEASTGADGAADRLDAGIGAADASRGSGAEAAEILLKIGAVFAEKGADAPADRAQVAAERLLARL